MINLIALFLPVLAAGVAHAMGLTSWLGAHPWWANKVIWIGLPVGIGLAATCWALGMSRRMRLVGATMLTFVAFGVAHAGKARFAASYAEDALAGQMWYAGWIATCAFAAATLNSLVWPSRSSH